MPEDSDPRFENRLQKFITDLSTTPPQSVNDDFFKSQMLRPKDWFQGMPHDWRQAEERKPKKFTLSNERKDFVSILKRGLGHIAANPSVPGNKHAMHLSYEFPLLANPAEFEHLGIGDDVVVINESHDVAKEFFVDTLGASAKQSAKNFRQRLMGSELRDTSTDSIYRNDTYLLIGERGVGKTFFLNYMLSQFTGDLHKEKCIVVRLDLTKEVDSDLSLEDWLHWKICKILFSYYDENSFDGDAEHNANDPILQHLVEKQDLDLLFDLRSTNDVLYDIAKIFDVELSRSEFKEHFRAIASHLRSPVDNTPRKLDVAWFFPMLWDYAVNNRSCSFITIFDGLDQLGLTNQDQQRYSRLLDAVTSYLSSEKNLWCAYLVTMRPKSWRDWIGDNNFRDSFNEVVVGGSECKLIYGKKKGYLQQRSFFEHRHETVEKLGQHYSTSISGFANAFMRFATLSLTRSVSPGMLEIEPESRSIDIGYGILTEIFGDNKRKTFQALTDASQFFATVLPSEFESMLHEAVNISDFFENLDPSQNVNVEVENPYREIMRYNYLLIEALMLENPRENFRREKYAYKISPEGKISTLNKNSRSVNHYLHNIFHHVVNPAELESPHLFVGVRLLQLGLTNPAFAKQKIVDLACQIFGYREDVVQQKFSEMLEDGLFTPHLDTNHIVVDNYSVTYAGRYVLTRLLMSLEYLCLAIQTTPLPRELVEKGFFPIRPHTSSEFVVLNKVLATLNFVRFADVVERRERTCFQSFIETASDDQKRFLRRQNFDKLFSVTSSMRQAIVSSILKIVDHAEEAELRGQLGQLDRIIAWKGIDHSINVKSP